MARITEREYAERLIRLQTEVARAELSAYLVSSFDNIYYLTGACYEPLERPSFFLCFPMESGLRFSSSPGSMRNT